MRIHPKQATVALNLLAIVAVVWLYCIDKIAADPVAAIPDRPSRCRHLIVRHQRCLSTGLRLELNDQYDLPAPPPASAVMPTPQAPVSQSSANKQALSEPTPPSEPALKPLAPQLAQEKKATIMPMIAPPINVKPAKSNLAAVKPLTVSPRQSKPIALASLAAHNATKNH